MRSCVRIPRTYLPRGEYEKWAVIACDRFSSDRSYWQRVAEQVGDAPSTLRLMLPEVYLGEDDEARAEEIRANMYAVLENESVEKLVRGLVLVERTAPFGVRLGVVAALDLEAYSAERGVDAPIRASQETDPRRLAARLAARRNMPLEFPHTVVFYRDKRDKLMRRVRGEKLEQLYDFDLMEGGGHLAGYFIPQDLAEDVVYDLNTFGDPFFAIADGNHAVAAAKAYWEEIKPDLTQTERRNHPARYTLAEFVNLYDETVCFHAVHRLVREVEPEPLCDYFMRSVRCKREGNVLIPSLPAGSEGAEKTDAILESYVRMNGGKIGYVHGGKRLQTLAAAEDCVGIMLKPMEKEDFYAGLKGGRIYHKESFSLGGSREQRYCFEGREISYD